jgi:nucleoside-diphosphate-sugar epimerase
LQLSRAADRLGAVGHPQLVQHPADVLFTVSNATTSSWAIWLPYLAKVVGAKPPLRLPAWLGRLLAGEFVVAQMTSWRGASNEKARKELGWEPRYASWREGFRAWVGG